FTCVPNAEELSALYQSTVNILGHLIRYVEFRTVDLQGDRMVEFVPLQHGYFTVYADSDLAHVLKERRAVIFYSNNGILITHSGFGQRDAGLVDVIAGSIGYGIAMWVELWKSQRPIEPLHQFFGFDMFQLLGNIMHFVPTEA